MEQTYFDRVKEAVTHYAEKAGGLINDGLIKQSKLYFSDIKLPQGRVLPAYALLVPLAFIGKAAAGHLDTSPISDLHTLDLVDVPAIEHVDSIVADINWGALKEALDSHAYLGGAIDVSGDGGLGARLTEEGTLAVQYLDSAYAAKELVLSRESVYGAMQSYDTLIGDGQLSPVDKHYLSGLVSDLGGLKEPLALSNCDAVGNGMSAGENNPWLEKLKEMPDFASGASSSSGDGIYSVTVTDGIGPGGYVDTENP